MIKRDDMGVLKITIGCNGFYYSVLDVSPDISDALKINGKYIAPMFHHDYTKYNERYWGAIKLLQRTIARYNQLEEPVNILAIEDAEQEKSILPYNKEFKEENEN